MKNPKKINVILGRILINMRRKRGVNSQIYFDLMCVLRSHEKSL